MKEIVWYIVFGEEIERHRKEFEEENRKCKELNEKWNEEQIIWGYIETD